MFINQILTKLKSLVYSKSETDSLLNGKASSSHTHTKSQITDFPTIPSKTSQLTNDSGFLTAHQSLSDYSTKANTVKSLSISGKTITVTPGSGNAYTLTTQDTTYTLPTASSTLGGVKTTSTVSNSSGYTACPIISGVPYYKDTNTTYSLSSLGIGNVKNYDQSKAIKSISRSGTTFTYTCLDGTTGTFTQQDNNTNTWTAMVGATSSANGSVGYVNAVPPKDGYNTKYLRADGTWQVPPDHTYTVNNATLTIQKNGTTVKTFTANASSNVTCNITVPTNTNELTNGAGFITSEIDSQSLGNSGWIRFKNGLQICWETSIKRNSLGTLYSWNKAFSAVFVAIASDVGPDNGNASQHLSDAVCIRPYSATQYRLGGYIAANPDKSEFYIQYIAIGKWK